MKKYIILFLLVQFLLSFNSINAQDVIIKHNGEEVKSKVIKVGKTDITYKNFDDPEFSNRSIKVLEVKMIRYEDGTEKIFNTYVHHYIGFSIGKSLSVGDYSSHNTNNSKAGYAQPGAQFTLDAGFYLRKNLGLAIAIGSYSNKLDTIALKETYQGSNVTTNFEKTERWTGGYFMTGALYSFKIGKRFVVDTKIMGGIMTLKKPSWSYHYVDNGGQDYDYNYEPGTGSSFGLTIGSSLRYNISKRLGLRFTLDFLKGKFKINYNTNITEPNSFGQRTEGNTMVQKAEIVKTGLGLVFLLNR